MPVFFIVTNGQQTMDYGLEEVAGVVCVLHNNY